MVRARGAQVAVSLVASQLDVLLACLALLNRCTRKHARKWQTCTLLPKLL